MGSGPSKYERIENFYGGQPDWNVPGLVRYRSGSERQRQQSSRQPSRRPSRGPTRQPSYNRPQQPARQPPHNPARQPSRSEPGQPSRQPSMHMQSNPDHYYASDDDHHVSEGASSITLIEDARGHRGDPVIGGTPSTPSRRPSGRRQPSQPRQQPSPSYPPPPSYHSQPPAAAAAHHPHTHPSNAPIRLGSASASSGSRTGGNGRPGDPIVGGGASSAPSRRPSHQRQASHSGLQNPQPASSRSSVANPNLQPGGLSSRQQAPPPFLSRPPSSVMPQQRRPMQPSAAAPTFIRSQPQFHSLPTAHAHTYGRSAVPGPHGERDGTRDRSAGVEPPIRHPQRASSRLGSQREREREVERTRPADLPSDRRPPPPTLRSRPQSSVTPQQHRPAEPAASASRHAPITESLHSQSRIRNLPRAHAHPYTRSAIPGAFSQIEYDESNSHSDSIGATEPGIQTGRQQRVASRHEGGERRVTGEGLSAHSSHRRPPPPPPPRRSHSRRFSSEVSQQTRLTTPAFHSGTAAAATQPFPRPPKIPLNQAATSHAPTTPQSQSRDHPSAATHLPAHASATDTNLGPNPTSTDPHGRMNTVSGSRTVRVGDHDSDGDDSDADVEIRGAAMMDFAPITRMGHPHQYRDSQRGG